MAELTYREILPQRSVDDNSFARGVQNFIWSLGHPTSCVLSKSYFRFEIEVNSDRAQYWLGVGAQPTEQVMALLKLTGDWGTFKGEKGAKSTVQAPGAKEEFKADTKKKPVLRPKAAKVEKPAEEAPVAEAPAEEAPAGEEAPAADAVTEEAATAEAPAEEAVAEAPAEEAPAEEAPAAE